MRLLVIDDHTEWLEPLYAMYETILGANEWEILSAQHYLDALRLLRTGFDLLSLDIILAGDRRPDAEGHISEANGLALLRQASAHHWTNGVILITGLHQDAQLLQVLDEGETGAEVRAMFSEIAERHFSGKHIIFNKQDKMSVQENVELFKQALTAQRLHRLAEATTLPPPYTLDVLLDEETPRVVIRSRKGKRKIHELGDAKFLQSLAINKDDDPFYVLKQDAYLLFFRTYRDRVRTEPSRENLTPERREKALASYIQNMRDRLKRIGIDPGQLFVVERGLGWKLHPDVRVIGLNADTGRAYGGDARLLENRAFDRDTDEDDQTPSDNT